MVIAAAVASADLDTSIDRPLGPGAIMSVIVPFDEYAGCASLAPGLADALAETTRRPVRIDCFRRPPDDHLPESLNGGVVLRPHDDQPRRSGDPAKKV